MPKYYNIITFFTAKLENGRFIPTSPIYSEDKSFNYEDESDKSSISLEHLENLKKFSTEKLLHFLGRWNGRKIIAEYDFIRLVEYTNYLIENNQVPNNITPINIKIPMVHLRYTFFLIHEKVNGNRANNTLFVEFLCAIFPSHFSETKNKKTTKVKFSTKPKNYDFDVKKILGKIGKSGK